MPRFTPQVMLVTGGAGFIGSNFVRETLRTKLEVQVVTLDALTYAGSQENLAEVSDNPHHVFVHGDISDQGLVKSLLRKYHIDTVVHFAAESHVDRSIVGPGDFIQTNVVGTFTLLEEARRFWLEEQHWDQSHCRFHHISTDEVYGTLGLDAPPFIETTPYQPNSPY